MIKEEVLDHYRNNQVKKYLYFFLSNFFNLMMAIDKIDHDDLDK